MIRVKAQLNFPKPQTTDVSTTVSRFLQEEGERVVGGVRDVLGQSELMTLSEGYREEKMAGRTVPPMKRYPGKAPDQPGILSGALYEGLEARETRKGVVTVMVREGVGLEANGDDYAEKIQERGDYLGKGLARVEGTHDEELLDALMKGLGF